MRGTIVRVLVVASVVLVVACSDDSTQAPKCQVTQAFSSSGTSHLTPAIVRTALRDAAQRIAPAPLSALH